MCSELVTYHKLKAQFSDSNHIGVNTSITETLD